MNQRSQFIPSIAKSMASILQRRTPTRRQRPTAQNPHSEPADPFREERETADLRTKIKRCLWRTAQKQLFNPNASRKLPPLHSVFTPDDELLDYIAGEDDPDALLSNGDAENCYPGMDSGFWDGSEGGDLFGCIAEEEQDRLWLGFSDDDENDHDDDDGLLDSVHSDYLLDIDSEDGGQRSGCGGDDSLPSAGISSSFLPTLSPQWSRNFSSESEMLTDPVEENPNDGFLANDVDMLCTA
ncbi:hypothetical protein PHISP_03107 [Aspergillus sp. HF37]|nr:hypothetical protein PHISP_03107 [Aspergillus sp. HF37]